MGNLSDLLNPSKFTSPDDAESLSYNEVKSYLPTGTTPTGGSRLGSIGKFLTTPLIRPKKSSWQVYAERNPQEAQMAESSGKPNVLKQLMDEVDDIAIGMTSPLNLAGMAALSKAPAHVQKLIGVAFGAPMIAHGIEAIEEENYPKAILNLTLGVAATTPAALEGVGMLQRNAVRNFGPRGLAEEGGFMNLPEAQWSWKSAGEALKRYWEVYKKEEDRPGRRIERLEKRAGKTVGFHKNTRRYLDDGDGQFPVGPQSPKDFVAMVKGYGTDEEIVKAAEFYDRSKPVFSRFMGIADAPTKLLSFGFTQKNTGVTEGLKGLLITEREMAGLQEPKSGGLAGEEIRSITRGDVPSAGVAQKLSDFIDSLFMKNTRTIMNDDPKYGSPFAVDTHMFRVFGYVDPGYYSFLLKRFGEKALRGVVVDRKPGSKNEAMYELIVKQGNELAPVFREQKLAGKDDWTPAQVQAALWAAFRKKLGLSGSSPEGMFHENASTMPFEVAFGDGSPFEQTFPSLYELPYDKNARITDYVATKTIREIAEQSGVRIIGESLPPGVYKGYVNPSMTVEALGTESAVGEFQAALGYLLNQTDMLAYRIKSRIGRPGRAASEEEAYEAVTHVPKSRLEDEEATVQLHSGIDILLPDKLRDRGAFVQFFNRLRELVPTIDGASSVLVDKKPAMRIIETGPTKSAPDRPTLWKIDDYRRIESAVDQVAREFKLDPNSFSTDWFGADMIRSHNNWKEDITGNGHLTRLDQAGRSAYKEELVNTYRPKVEQWIREGFEKYAPEAWSEHQAKYRSEVEQAAIERVGGAAEAGAEPAFTPVKASALGRPVSDLSTLTRGWLLPDGAAVQVESHPKSVAKVLGLKDLTEEQAQKLYPQFGAERGLVRIIYRRNPSRIFAELFDNPTDAQLRSLAELEKAHWKLVFAFTDPRTSQMKLNGYGEGVNQIRRKWHEIEDAENAAVPF